MGDRLATIGMGRKWGGAAVGGSWVPLGPHLAQCGLGRGLPLYQVAYLDPSNRLATTVGMPRSSAYEYAYGLFFIPSLVVKTFTGCVH